MGFIIKPVVTEKMAKLTEKSSEDKVVKHKGEKRTILAQPKYVSSLSLRPTSLRLRKKLRLCTTLQ